MGVFPQGASIIANPYNKIPGFWLPGRQGGATYFVPGFPVMAWPMIEWVLDNHYVYLHHTQQVHERSVIVLGAMESTLTPLMLEIEAAFPAVKVFSLPSVDHPVLGRHIDLGVKGRDVDSVLAAFAMLHQGLMSLDVAMCPEKVREAH